MRRILKSPLASAFILIALSACDKSSGTPPPPNPGDKQVSMENNMFMPGTITVAAGTMVTWTNNDAMDHTVTNENGIFDSGNIQPGITYSYRFDDAGTFTYHCALHAGMQGTVVVE